jgi:hypothetical protein
MASEGLGGQGQGGPTILVPLQPLLMFLVTLIMMTSHTR